MDHLLTMSDAHPAWIADGAVDVEDGRVAWVGSADEAPPGPAESVEHIRGILMPGMVDTHAHSPMVLLRGIGEGLPVDRWLREVMWPREGRITPEDAAAGMRMGAVELLLNGVTTSVEMYFQPQALAEAIDDIGIRCLIAAAVIDQGQLSRFGSWQQQIDDVLALAERWSSHDRIDVAFGPHDPTLPEACLRSIAETAGRTDMLVHTHVVENEADVAAIQTIAGTTAPAYLESIGMLEPRFLAAHAVWMTDADIEIFARNDVAVAHCPCSNMKHGSGIARVEDMVGAGVGVAIATDGPASHHRLDLFEEMRTAIRLARVSGGGADALPAPRALRMVTADAADAIGRDDLGRIEAGSWADMVALDPDTIALNPVVDGDDDPVSRVVWSGSPAAIAGVWVAGERLVDHGRLTRLDIADIVANAHAAAVRLAG